MMEKRNLIHNLEERGTELEEVSNALLSREEELITLNKICVEVNRSLELQEILERTLDIMLPSMGLEAGFIFLFDEAREEFTLKALQGMRSRFDHGLITMKAGCDFPTATPGPERLVAVQEISEYPRLGRFLRDREGFHSYISVPLSANGKLVGMLNVFSRGRTLVPQEVSLLVAIGQQVGAAIENAQTFQKVVRAKREWEETFDAITEGLFMLDEEFNILRVNIAFAEMLGTTPARLIGQKCYRVLHNRDEPPSYCLNVQTMQTGVPQTIEVREPAVERDLLLSIYPLRNPEGNVDRQVHIIQDITLRKQLQAQLVQAEKLSAIGRLAQGIAHNLLTPLTVIRGRTQLVSEEARDFFEARLPPLLRRLAGRRLEARPDIAQVYDDMRQELFAIERGCRTMEEIINNLMYKSRREQEEHKQLVDLNDLLWQELKFLDGDPRFKNNIGKVYNLSEAPLYVEGIYSDFSQSFSNLIRNAIDAMEGCEEPVLTITTRCNDDCICVDIHDTGAGIPAENIPHLFEPFFTTKPINGGNMTGTGLGLHSCYQLLSSYGTQFEVKSQPGDTTFTVKIPRR
jgi:two-component system NtrC family sensor kinase